MPFFFVHVWDTYLVPEASGINHFNAAIYENFDGIGCISKQTEWFVRNVMATSRPSIFNRPKVAYVGHGSDPFVFNPLPSEELKDIRSVVTGDKEFDFIALAVNANQARKKLPDIVEAWRIFNSQISRAEAVKTLLVVKSQLAHDMGTDLNAVTRALAPNCNVSLIAKWMSDVELNKIYNVADVFVSASNSEGFGLTANEAILAGTPVILNAVGGLVDQMGFTNVSNPQYSTYNNWSPEFFADLRHMQTGPWCYPLFGQRTIIGSPRTPFLYELNASIESIANGFLYWHAASAESRTSWGQIGREWTLRQGLTGQTFATNVVRDVSALIADFKPRDLFQLFPV
jgi:glycosyltransferase involved in cell wall biosynthesis